MKPGPDGADLVGAVGKDSPPVAIGDVSQEVQRLQASLVSPVHIDRAPIRTCLVRLEIRSKHPEILDKEAAGPGNGSPAAESGHVGVEGAGLNRQVGASLRSDCSSIIGVGGVRLEGRVGDGDRNRRCVAEDGPTTTAGNIARKGAVSDGEIARIHVDGPSVPGGGVAGPGALGVCKRGGAPNVHGTPIRGSVVRKGTPITSDRTAAGQTQAPAVGGGHVAIKNHIQESGRRVSGQRNPATSKRGVVPKLHRVQGDHGVSLCPQAATMVAVGEIGGDAVMNGAACQRKRGAVPCEDSHPPGVIPGGGVDLQVRR